jgi:hypothetical protein
MLRSLGPLQVGSPLYIVSGWLAHIEFTLWARPLQSERLSMASVPESRPERVRIL